MKCAKLCVKVNGRVNTRVGASEDYGRIMEEIPEMVSATHARTLETRNHTCRLCAWVSFVGLKLTRLWRTVSGGGGGFLSCVSSVIEFGTVLAHLVCWSVGWLIHKIRWG